MEETPPKLKKSTLLSQVIGPGVITGAADDDPSGIATYSVAGAQLGTTLLWMPGFTWPLMAAVQMMCARIGMVTGEGLASGFKKKFPLPVLVVACVGLVIANIFNIAADLAAMADSASTLTHINHRVFVVIFALAISLATIYLKYKDIARVLKWLALFLFAYVITAFDVGPDWSEVLRSSFIPTIPNTKEAWSTVVAILGTTISPYLFFWQASEEIEEAHNNKGSIKIWLRKIDVGIGTFFSNLIMFFIILTTAMTLHKHGITQIETSAQVAQALEPLAGRFAFLLYSIGILGVGFLAIPTLTGSAAYALCELFKWRKGLDETPKAAQAFYGVIIFSTVISVILDFLKFNPVKALYWSAVINGLLAPFLLVGIFLIASDNKLMKGKRSSLLGRSVVALTTVLMFIAAVAMFVI